MPADFRAELRKSCSVETKIQLRVTDNPYLTVFGDAELLEFKADSAALAQAARDQGKAFDRGKHDSLEFGGIIPTTLDSAGRFGIDEDLRDAVGITDGIFFIGASREIQLWDPQHFLDFGPKNRVLDGFCRKFMATLEAKRKAKA